MAVHIDRNDTLAAARVLMVINPHCSARYTAETLADFMESMAHRHLSTAPGYFGTAGFYLTSYARAGHPDDFHIIVTIMPSLVSDYIVSVAQRAGYDARIAKPDYDRADWPTPRG